MQKLLIAFSESSIMMRFWENCLYVSWVSNLDPVSWLPPILYAPRGWRWYSLWAWIPPALYSGPEGRADLHQKHAGDYFDLMVEKSEDEEYAVDAEFAISNSD